MKPSVLDLWSELKVLVASMEKDLAKNTTDGGNVSAGIRTRKSLRMLKAQVTLLLRSTLEADKEVKAARAAERDASKPKKAAPKTKKAAKK